MSIYIITMIMLWQFAISTSTSLSAPTFEVVDLGQSATLSCQGECSTSSSWTMGSKAYIVAHCNQTMCATREGFQMSHDQYLKGDLTLGISAVNYSKRTWYTCECDGQKIRHVYLRINCVDYRRQIEYGDSFIIECFISERVKITFNRTGDNEMIRPVTLYERSANDVSYHPDYDKRSESRSSFTVRDIDYTDSGVYTVWDADNQEPVASYTLTVTGKQVHIQWKLESGLMFFLGLGLGILTMCAMPWIVHAWRWMKKRICCSKHENNTAHECDSAHKVPLNSGS